MEKLEAIREACIKANPEIVELKEGCQIEYYDLIQIDVDDFRDDIAIVVAVLPLKIVMGFISNETIHTKEYRTFEYVSGEEKKIIGRPIRLNDVLLTFQELNIEVDLCNFVKSTHGVMNIKPYVLYMRRVNPSIWNLKEDDLTKQSPETVDFIYSLINPK